MLNIRRSCFRGRSKKIIYKQLDILLRDGALINVEHKQGIPASEAAAKKLSIKQLDILLRDGALINGQINILQSSEALEVTAQPIKKSCLVIDV